MPEVVETKKPWYSKTMLLNLFMGLAAFFAPMWPAFDSCTWLKESSNIALVGTIWGGLAMVLRLVTKDKIVLRD